MFIILLFVRTKQIMFIILSSPLQLQFLYSSKLGRGERGEMEKNKRKISKISKENL